MRRVGKAAAFAAMLKCAAAVADPTIVASDVVRIELIASDPVALADVDMLAFDAFGNLMANRETVGNSGGVSYVDIENGMASILVNGISRADGITLHPSGALYVTSEVSGASSTLRVFRVDVAYDAGHTPTSATRTSITTSLAINNPEGIVALMQDSVFGSSGDLYVCEDRDPGRVLHLVLGAGNTASATESVGTAANLRRPEGLTFGEFGGFSRSPALFMAETTGDNVLRIESDGSVGVVGTPGAVALDQPDNVKFGHDGKLYVTEDLNPGRVIRIDAAGNHQVALSGFNLPQGMAFDMARRDLYIAEQGLDRVWRARFATATGDADADGDVDLVDFAAFQDCADEAGGLPQPQCLLLDYDRDDDVDLDDYSGFHAALTGSQE